MQTTTIVTNLEARLFTSGACRLVPGPNTLDSAEWAKERQHPIVKKRLELGLIVEGNAPAGTVAPRFSPVQTERFAELDARFKAEQDRLERDYQTARSLLEQSGNVEDLQELQDAFDSFKGLADQREQELRAELEATKAQLAASAELGALAAGSTPDVAPGTQPPPAGPQGADDKGDDKGKGGKGKGQSAADPAADGAK